MEGSIISLTLLISALYFCIKETPRLDRYKQSKQYSLLSYTRCYLPLEVYNNRFRAYSIISPISYILSEEFPFSVTMAL